ncbi:MAG: ferritin-like domain-containing protein [Bryobacteraceae bacterium]
MADKNRELLVALLHEAAQVEHTLLCAYLYAAYTLKTMPQEFVGEGEENPRRALQFELTRAWKQSILMAAREEMRHVHYVQSLLRTLGERAWFVLPVRNEIGNWVFRDWREKVFVNRQAQMEDVEIPLATLRQDTAQRFVLYESGDWMQDANPFGPRITKLFEKLFSFEIKTHIEQIVMQVPDQELQSKLREQLTSLYASGPAGDSLGETRVGSTVTEGEGDDLPKFTSIADLYLNGILPLFQEGFELGWVKRNNFNLTAELSAATQGSVSVGPEPRTAKFSKLVASDFSDPIDNYEDVSKLITEIVTEGEGMSNFEFRAESMLGDVERWGGASAFARLVQMNSEQVADAMLLRNSHAYRFAMILRGLEKEQTAHPDFSPAREPLVVDPCIRMRQLTHELPGHFNACYLVLLTWLERIYETENWNEDARRRHAIEQIATWPMMSMAIRPFLELSSYLPVQETMLFRTDAEALPMLPVFARQLLELFLANDRTPPTVAQMDTLAVRVLGATASWAKHMKEAVEGSELKMPPWAHEGIMTRLNTLEHLKEFAEQYKFRVAGGYSNQLPDLAYQRAQTHAKDYAEDPYSTGDPAGPQTALFSDTAVVRLRFSGWASLQMATDFDPPTDEAGCTGNVFLRCSDGPGKRLNRALKFQATASNGVILREPRKDLPQIGVNVVDASLLMTKGQATAGYRPVTTPHAAIMTNSQAYELTVTGLSDLCKIEAAAISKNPVQMELQAKKHASAHLVGQNHLVWQNGEPIDPFVLTVQGNVPDVGPPELWFQREVYNEGKSILSMTPIQRLYSARWMFGGTPNGLVPAWVPRSQVRETDATKFSEARSLALAQRLTELLKTPVDTQQKMDEAVSLAERIPAICTRWLAAHTHYGHTISGDFTPGLPTNDIFAAIEQETGVQVSLTNKVPRTEANGRWLAEYNLASYDTDAMACLVYGELYIPVDVSPSGGTMRFSHSWRVPAGSKDALVAVGCDFNKGMTGQTAGANGARTATTGKGNVQETLMASGVDSYTYSIGLPGVTSMTAEFSVSTTGDTAVLQWNATLTTTDAVGTIDGLTYVGECIEGITNRLQQYFAPQT